MPLFEPTERTFAEAVSELTYGNPFLPERIESERKALGEELRDQAEVWHRQGEPGPEQQRNVARIGEKAEQLVGRILERRAGGARPAAGDEQLYEDLAVYLLYDRYQQSLLKLITGERGAASRVPFYRAYRRDAERLLAPCRKVRHLEPDHLFACFFQVRRAFHHSFHYILGGSMPAARLRAAVWQSIFTHDVRRYRRALYDRMGELTTLITGPSGTGKELVARAIGLSRFLPFDPSTQSFEVEPDASFYALNLSALSPTVIESELFGHAKGAFTGASTDRAGWLEVCPPRGTVFLDELGEVEPSIQVKLLRVLQSRAFERLGETKSRRFHGKIIAATNRDLGALLAEGRLREDLFYRLCSDLITTPSLAEQLGGSGEELRHLLLLLARRLLEEDEARELAEEVANWIEKGERGDGAPLGADYPWPGNVRELEQCLRNVLIRRRYRPPARAPRDGGRRFLAELEAGELEASRLLAHYTTWVYHLTGSYQEAARRLGIDRRTVKARVDRELLERFRSGAQGGG